MYLGKDLIPLTIKDTQKIAQLETECFRDHWSIQQIQDELTQEGNISFGVFYQEILVAYIMSRCSDYDCWLMRIAVSPNYRRQGYAEQLINESWQVAMVAPDGYLLEVNIHNQAAISLYEKCGFVVTGRRKNYYPTDQLTGTADDALMMHKKL